MRFLLFLTVFLFPYFLIGQTTISGVVSDQQGKGIPGANIFIKDSYDGTTSDVNGKFSFSTAETGDQILAVSFIGFKPSEQKIILNGSNVEIKIKLKESLNELKAVTIAAGAFEASDEKKMVILKPLDIVTTAGASGDIYGAIQTLPGTGVVGEKEGLYVRGGDANEARTYIDGLLVDNPYFSSVPDVPQRGRFSPFLFKGTSFSSGGYSAQYGQAMSSALILESQDLPDRSATNLGIMSVGGSIGHTKRYKKSSIGVFGGYTDLRPYYKIVKQDRDWIQPPRSVNASSIFRMKTSESGILKAFVSYTWTDLVISFPDTSDALLLKRNKFILRNSNIYTSLSYKEIIFKNWTVYAAASFSDNKDDKQIDELPLSEKNNLFESRLTLSHTFGELSILRFGGEYQLPGYKFSVPGFNRNFNERYSAIYIEGDIYITPKLVARAGLRGENSDAISRSNIAPRISLAYKTGKYNQVSFAYGNFYQVPGKEYLFSGPTVNFKYEMATHYILNFQHISDYRTFRVEAFYKNYDNLIRNINTIDNSGYGNARGFELFYRDKKTFAFTDLWISYSFLDTKRLYREFPVEAMPTFAAKHTASLVFKYWIPKLSMSPSLTYVYSTGRPYFNPNNSVFLSDRTKDYHNLSLNLSYLTSIGKSFTVLVFSVGNVLGIENIYTYNYSSDGSRRFAVGPPAKRTFFLGLFININSQTDDSDKYN